MGRFVKAMEGSVRAVQRACLIRGNAACTPTMFLCQASQQLHPSDHACYRALLQDSQNLAAHLPVSSYSPAPSSSPPAAPRVTSGSSTCSHHPSTQQLRSRHAKQTPSPLCWRDVQQREFRGGPHSSEQELHLPHIPSARKASGVGGKLSPLSAPPLASPPALSTPLVQGGGTPPVQGAGASGEGDVCTPELQRTPRSGHSGGCGRGGGGDAGNTGGSGGRQVATPHNATAGTEGVAAGTGPFTQRYPAVLPALPASRLRVTSECDDAPTPVPYRSHLTAAADSFVLPADGPDAHAWEQSNGGHQSDAHRAAALGPWPPSCAVPPASRNSFSFRRRAFAAATSTASPSATWLRRRSPDPRRGGAESDSGAGHRFTASHHQGRGGRAGRSYFQGGGSGPCSPLLGRLLGDGIGHDSGRPCSAGLGVGRQSATLWPREPGPCTSSPLAPKQLSLSPAAAAAGAAEAAAATAGVARVGAATRAAGAKSSAAAAGPAAGTAAAPSAATSAKANRAATDVPLAEGDIKRPLGSRQPHSKPTLARQGAGAGGTCAPAVPTPSADSAAPQGAQAPVAARQQRRSNSHVLPGRAPGKDLQLLAAYVPGAARNLGAVPALAAGRRAWGHSPGSRAHIEKPKKQAVTPAAEVKVAAGGGGVAQGAAHRAASVARSLAPAGRGRSEAGRAAGAASADRACLHPRREKPGASKTAGAAGLGADGGMPLRPASAKRNLYSSFEDTARGRHV